MWVALGRIAGGIAIFALLAFSPEPARAQAPPEISEALSLAGMDAALDQVPGLIKAQVETRQEDLSSGLAGELERAMLEAFSPALLKADARATLAAQYEPGEFDQGLLWLRSPLGRRIVGLEIAAGKDENQAAMGEWIESIPRNPPSKDRIILVADVVRASDSLTIVIETIVLVAEPILQTLNAAAAEDEKRSPDEIRLLLGVMRDRLEDPMGRQMLLRSLYTYREASDEELSNYAAFLRSEAGQGLYQALNASVIAVLERAGGRFAESFGSVHAR